VDLVGFQETNPSYTERLAATNLTNRMFRVP